MQTITKQDCQRTAALFAECHGNVAEMARRAGVTRSTIQHRLSRMDAHGVALPSLQGSMNAARSVLRLTELEQKVKALTAQNKMLLDESMTGEKVKSFIHEAKRYAPIPPKWMLPKATHGLTGTPVLVGSDWHWGETVYAAQMNGLNAFNQEIAHRRAERFFAKPVDLLLNHMAHPKYDRIIVPILGDMLSGNIHEELAETNWAPVAVCMMDLVAVLIAGFDQLLKAFGKVYVPWVVGNHGRTHKKMRFKNRAFDSYEWIMGHMLAHHYAGNADIHFEIAESPNLPFSVYSTKFLCNHGDEFRGGSGISGSWSPIIRGDAKKRKQAMAVSRPYDYLLIGHWHNLQRMSGVRGNGSLKGFDEYASGNGFEFQAPLQDLFVVHPAYGITAEWSVHLEVPGTTYGKFAKAVA